MNLLNIRHRERLGAFLNEHNLLGAMAEVGCAFGGYSRVVLNDWKGSKYVMVDPWIKQSKQVYKEKTDGIDYNGWFENCKRLAEQDRRVQLIRKYSIEAAAEIADESLDCVYLDGNHAGEAVDQDIKAWWPKVRGGGIVGGHDFYTDIVTPGYFNQVDGPVKAFVFSHGLPLAITPCSSWWVEKPTR
jgi:hypothetical protein